MSYMVGVLRRGSPERMDYIRRFVAVLLALALCMGLVRPPRVQAAAGTGTLIAVTASVNPLAAVGVILLAAVGIAIAQEVISSGVAGSAVYDEGQKLMDVLAVDPECTAWYRTQQKLVESGLKPGTKIQVPAHVMKAARKWVGETYDFSGGTIAVNRQGIFSGNTVVFFTEPSFDSLLNSSVGITQLGTVFHNGDSIVFGNTQYNLKFWYSLPANDWWGYGWIIGDSFVCGTQGGYDNILENYANKLDGALCLYTSSGLSYILPVLIDSATNKIVISPSSERYLQSVSDLVLDTAVLFKTPELDIPLEGDQTMTVPNDIPTTIVDGLPVPVITELDREAVIVGSGEIVNPTVAPTAVPETGTKVGDIALEDVAAQQESLGAVFVSKFPFCIPWDMYNAVKLLAAPAKTPYWEVDFLAPISSRVGGWRGSTKVVIDMGEYEIIGQLCRWVSTILFCATLISGTKRLIWTG